MGPWAQPDKPENFLPREEAETSCLSDVFVWLEKGTLFESYETAKEAIAALKQEFKIGNVEFSDFERVRISKMIERYYHKHAELTPWRDKIQAEEGRKEFINIIGQGLIDPETVTLDLSHPVFIGVLFKDEYEARKFREQTAGRVDEVGGWVTLSNYASDPTLNLSCYFGVEGLREQDVTHETQHLMFGNVYDPRLQRLPLGKRPTLDRFTTREEVEYNLFLNEVLAYLKAGEWPQSMHQVFNGNPEGGFPDLSFEDMMNLKKKYFFFKNVIKKEEKR